MSIMNTLSPDIDDDDDVFFEPQPLEEQLKGVLEENLFLQKEVSYLSQAVNLLVIELKKHDPSYFNYNPLAKKPIDMTKEELLEANKAVTARVNAKAKSAYVIPMPTEDEKIKLAEKRAEEVRNMPGMQFLLDILLKDNDKT